MPNICGKSLPVCYSIFTISFFLTNKIPMLLNTLQPTLPSLQRRPMWIIGWKRKSSCETSERFIQRGFDELAGVLTSFFLLPASRPNYSWCGSSHLSIPKRWRNRKNKSKILVGLWNFHFILTLPSSKLHVTRKGKKKLLIWFNSL